MYSIGTKVRTYGIILVFLLIMAARSVLGQSDSLQVSLPVDTLVSPSDSLLLSNANTLPDSTASSESINASIFYDALDSMVFDAVNNMVRLYNGAVVKYEDMTVEAAYIEYSFETNEACASAVPDSAGVLTGKPKFDDGGQSFTQEYMCYNFRTQQGYSKQSVTQEGDAVFHAGQSKRHINEWIHIKNGKFTTCDAENPHYHFHLRKAIIVPDDKVVSGPLYLKVRKVPLPLALPFAWFPTKNESSHGIILPGYGNSPQLGYFLTDGGYYLPLGRYADTRILADIYSRGSWTIANLTNYKKRYKYSGSFNISRSVIKQSLQELPDFSRDTEFFIRWTHNQDPKARPNSRFSANINFGTSNNFRNNINSNQQDYLTNTFNSSVQWNKTFAGTPYSLAVNARHSQNSTTGNVQLTLPGITLNRNRTNIQFSELFGNKGRKKWYDDVVGLTYSANFENFITESIENFDWSEAGRLTRQAQNGIQQNVTLTSQIKAAFVTITPTFNYSEFWAFKYVDALADDSGIALEKDTLNGFRTARSWRVGASANTRFYGTFNFRKSKNLKAIRHVLTPQAGLSYVPFADRNRYFYNSEGVVQSFNPFEAARYRPGNSNEQFNVNFSLSNNLEMKVRDRQAGKNATKKVKIIENFVASGRYNMIADSLNLSSISMRGFTTLFKNLTLNYNSSYSAYDRDSDGREINRYLIDTQNRLLRLENMSASLNSTFRSQNRTGNKNTDNASEEQLDAVNRNRDQFVDFTVPWSLTASYALGLNRTWDSELQADQDNVTQSILLRGDLTVLERWKIGFDTGYDFEARELTPTTLNIYWDLHCWELTFDWIPFGVRRSFNIQLNVKSSLLRDLKLQARGGANGLLF